MLFGNLMVEYSNLLSVTTLLVWFLYQRWCATVRTVLRIHYFNTVLSLFWPFKKGFLSLLWSFFGQISRLLTYLKNQWFFGSSVQKIFNIEHCSTAFFIPFMFFTPDPLRVWIRQRKLYLSKNCGIHFWDLI